MQPIHILAPVGLALLLSLGGCVIGPAPGPSLVAVPGKNKDLAAFRLDDDACRKQTASVVAQPAPAPAGAATTAAEPISPDTWYANCMIAKGNVMQTVPTTVTYPTYAYPYAAPYPYAYPYGYGYPYAYPGYGPYFGPSVALGFGYRR